jgi:hypothetical protein
MTLARIQGLESLGFEWKPSIISRQGIPKKPSLDEDTARVYERAVEPLEDMQQHSLKRTSAEESSAAIDPEESNSNGKVHLDFISGPTSRRKRV